ncbi:anti-sigma factor antagonist [Nocardia neocaledoniensis]|uniref:anti-sigma factor antagonist n=1 Tax=Nocardia neocaledoniensis TaxID=236511 RepID=UPI0024562034|nr:anti-sigma factor antagonist [Nocardia neocaledoniensis]
MKSRPHSVELVLPDTGETEDLGLRLQADLDLRADAVILHVYGEADAYTRPRWRAVLDAAVAEATPRGCLVVDVSAIQFVGCRPILDLAERAQQASTGGVRVVMFNPYPGVVDRVITIAGLSAWLPIYPTLAEALNPPVPARPVVPTPGTG